MMGNVADEMPGWAERLSSSDVAGLLTGSDEDLVTPRRWPRVSRGCYDKFRRCPGWAGGGMRYARVRRCDNGFLKTYDDNGMLPLWWLRFYRCQKCGVLVLPHATKNLDPSWLRYRITRRWESLAYAARKWQERSLESAEQDPGYWEARWPLPVRAALFPLGFAIGTLEWLVTDLADRVLPGSGDAWEYWYNRRARKQNRKANGELAREAAAEEPS